MTWDVPVKDDCPVCGKTMFKRAGKGYKRPYCINPECANFLPEDKRGYHKKAEDTAEKKTAKTAKKAGAKTAKAATRSAAKAPAKTAKKAASKSAAKTKKTAEKE